MSRLRVRVELNRGGIGVPLHKLSSIVQEAEKFFQMLAADVNIETSSGEWLAFDFDNESLNFTAEYVGPVSSNQVEAFSKAFDGTTPLRRATIAQFTRITEAIGQDELIGFGLYQSDEELEPTEWRCLSRRDALRIADEIQLLMGVSGETTHLPAVIDHGTSARLFKERHERAALPPAEGDRLPELMREVEAHLSKRLARMENDIEEHSRSITELKETSSAAEDSFRNLLSSVETFCAQATRQLERISTPAQLPAPALAAAPATPTAPAIIPKPPVAASAPARSTPPQPAPAVSVAARIPQPPAFTPSTQPLPGRGWRAYAVAAIVIIGVVSGVVLLWSPKSDSSESQVSAASVPPPSAETQRKSPIETSAKNTKTAPTTPAVKAAVKHATPEAVGSNETAMHVEIEAREPAWVSVTDGSGKRLMSKTMDANETEALDLTSGAVLRTGNAGGVVVRVNGKEIGPLGPTGKIRDISFKNGAYKIRTPDAG